MPATRKLSTQLTRELFTCAWNNYMSEISRLWLRDRELVVLVGVPRPRLLELVDLDRRLRGLEDGDRVEEPGRRQL